jgi:hypothetical protein
MEGLPAASGLFVAAAGVKRKRRDAVCRTRAGRGVPDSGGPQGGEAGMSL